MTRSHRPSRRHRVVRCDPAVFAARRPRPWLDSRAGVGLSFVDMRRAGLSGLWMPSDETLRYEVELLRCREVDVDDRVARVCCSDADYPCEAGGA